MFWKWNLGIYLASILSLSYILSIDIYIGTIKEFFRNCFSTDFRKEICMSLSMDIWSINHFSFCKSHTGFDFNSTSKSIHVLSLLTTILLLSKLDFMVWSSRHLSTKMNNANIFIEQLDLGKKTKVLGYYILKKQHVKVGRQFIQ